MLTSLVVDVVLAGAVRKYAFTARSFLPTGLANDLAFSGGAQAPSAATRG
jgi:hypothetical protein